MGLPIRRTIVYSGIYWGPLILANYQIECTNQGNWLVCDVKTLPKSNLEARKGTHKTRLHPLTRGLYEFSAEFCEGIFLKETLADQGMPVTYLKLRG